VLKFIFFGRPDTFLVYP